MVEKPIQSVSRKIVVTFFVKGYFIDNNKQKHRYFSLKYAVKHTLFAYNVF